MPGLKFDRKRIKQMEILENSTREVKNTVTRLNTLRAGLVEVKNEVNAANGYSVEDVADVNSELSRLKTALQNFVDTL